MDRNTLTAFFLIALVLLFTPKYMELFGPPLEPENNDDSLRVVKPETNPQQKTTADKAVAVFTQSNDKPTKHLESFTKIETPLYTATFSNKAGGTIKEFRFNNYLTSDSQLVNIISNNPTENLAIDLKNLDGEKALLDIGVGKAGDLNHWLDTRFNLVIGIDLNRDNLRFRKL